MLTPDLKAALCKSEILKCLLKSGLRLIACGEIGVGEQDPPPVISQTAQDVRLAHLSDSDKKMNRV